MAVEKIGVVGAGQMGNGIAHVLALAGYDVVLDDINKDALSKAIGLIEKNMQRQAHKGIIKEEQVKPALARIRTTQTLDDRALHLSSQVGGIQDASTLVGHVEVTNLDRAGPCFQLDAGRHIGALLRSAGDSRSDTVPPELGTNVADTEPPPDMAPPPIEGDEPEVHDEHAPSLETIPSPPLAEGEGEDEDPT